MIQGQQTHISSLHFASNQMLGNIGAPLDGESFIEEEEEGKEGEMQMENIKEDHERFYETQRWEPKPAVGYDVSWLHVLDRPWI